jgi:hypothetical protein
MQFASLGFTKVTQIYFRNQPAKTCVMPLTANFDAAKLNLVQNLVV